MSDPPVPGRVDTAVSTDAPRADGSPSRDRGTPVRRGDVTGLGPTYAPAAHARDHGRVARMLFDGVFDLDGIFDGIFDGSSTPGWAGAGGSTS